MLCPYLTWDSVVGKFLSPFERRLASSAHDYNRYVHRLCMYLCTSLYEYITMAFKGCHSVKGLCRHCMFHPRTKLKRFTNGCRTWRLRCSLDMQLGNYVLLFNGVNQISANGKKGKTLHKSWQSRKNRMTELLDINYRGRLNSYGWWWKYQFPWHGQVIRCVLRR